MENVLSIILAGGLGERLSILSQERAKPAVPFAGKYRIIDFTLSNCVNSGIGKVFILTQYQPLSLAEHIGIGTPWGLVPPDRSMMFARRPISARVISSGGLGSSRRSSGFSSNPRVRSHWNWEATSSPFSKKIRKKPSVKVQPESGWYSAPSAVR